MVGAEDVAGAVDKEEMIAFFHGRMDSVMLLRGPSQRRFRNSQPSTS
jgi:hypothetical protein